MTDRTTPRSDVTRAKTARRRPWAPPSKLDAPKPKDGYKHRWIRTHLRLREGYEPVRADEYPDQQFASVEEGKHEGVIGNGGLMLAKIPEETVEERTEYFRDQTRNQMTAVDQDLMKEQHPSMPIEKSRRSKVTFGKE